MSVNEIIEEYDDVPLEDRAILKENFANSLRKAGMKEKNIKNAVRQWKRGADIIVEEGDGFNSFGWSSKDELMNMMGAETEEEFNDLEESNGFF